MRHRYLVILLSVLLAPVVAVAAPDKYHVADSVTVTWDAVTTQGDGTALSADGAIEYEIFYAPMDRSNPVSIWRGPETTATISLPAQGKYLLGIQTILVVEQTDANRSPFGWTDDPEIVGDTDGDGVGDTWGLMWFMPPGQAKGFIKQ